MCIDKTDPVELLKADIRLLRKAIAHLLDVPVHSSEEELRQHRQVFLQVCDGVGAPPTHVNPVLELWDAMIATCR